MIDNVGKGLNIPFDEEARQRSYEKIKKDQEDSLADWINYLSDKENPFPTWFKVYAFDGLTKLGRYDNNAKKYTTRDKTTTDPYPDLEPAALANTLDTINGFFDKNDRNWFNEHVDDEVILSLVKTGNFNKLYSSFYTKSIERIPTPEKTEDIKGVWVEYRPGQEKEIANSSRGTGWCIESSREASHYLKTNENIQNNQAKFILFKLENKDASGGLSKTACASIRLDVNGRVIEVSGIAKKQSIEDSLVPIVEQEAKKYPFDPDKNFESKFRDKKKLISLWQKMQANQVPTVDEINFLYEKNRKIESLDTHHQVDPKIAPLREKFDLKCALDVLDKESITYKEKDISFLLEKSTSGSISKCFKQLQAAGMSVGNIMDRLDSYGFSENYDNLRDSGVDVKTLFDKMNSWGISENYEALKTDKVDVKALLNKMNSWGVSEYYSSLKSDGVEVRDILNRMDSIGISEHFSDLISEGITPNEILDKIQNSQEVFMHFDDFKSYGISGADIVDKMGPGSISEHFSDLISEGISIKQLFSKMDSNGISKHFSDLVSKGITPKEILDKIQDSPEVFTHFNDFKSYGISVTDIVDKMPIASIDNHFSDIITKYPSSVKAIFLKEDSDFINKHISDFINNGVSAEDILNKLGPLGVEVNFRLLIENGVSAKVLFDRVRNVYDHIEDFLNAGIPKSSILERLEYYDIALNNKNLAEMGFEKKVLLEYIDKRAIRMFPRDLIDGIFSKEEILDKLNKDDVATLSSELLDAGFTQSELQARVDRYMDEKELQNKISQMSSVLIKKIGSTYLAKSIKKLLNI